MAKLSKALLKQTDELLQKHGGIKARAAEEAGVVRSTFDNRVRALQVAIAKGEYEGDLPGFGVKKLSEDIDEDGTVTRRFVQQAPAREEAVDPENMSLKGLSQYVAHGEIVGEWRKWDKDKIDPVETAKQVAEAFKGMKVKLPRIDCPPHNIEDQLALYPLADLHIGMMAWGKETVINWDLDIGVNAIRKTMSEIIPRTQSADTAIILVAGDLLHSDNSNNTTARSGNILDVDGRYLKVVRAACRLMLDITLMAKQKHRNVVVRVIPGNHDIHSSAAVAFFLEGVFCDDERVTVDTDPSPHFVYTFGDVLIAATHGHTMKPEKFQAFVSSAYREKWGAAKHAYGFMGHLHHQKRIADEVSGMLIEQLPAPVPPDHYHWGAGYISGRALTAFNFHAKDGMVGKVNQTLRRGD